jgi:hypothetical protein
VAVALKGAQEKTVVLEVGQAVTLVLTAAAAHRDKGMMVALLKMEVHLTIPLVVVGQERKEEMPMPKILPEMVVMGWIFLACLERLWEKTVFLLVAQLAALEMTLAIPVLRE